MGKNKEKKENQEKQKPIIGEITSIGVIASDGKQGNEPTQTVEDEFPGLAELKTEDVFELLDDLDAYEVKIARRKKRWKIVLCIFLAVVLSAALFYAYMVEQVKRYSGSTARQSNLELKQLYAEKSDIEARLTEIAKETTPEVGDFGTVVFLCTDCGTWVSEKMAPLADSYDYPCCILLSKNSLPGMEDCISLEQYRHLLNIGWCGVAQANSPEELNELYAALDEAGIARPTSLYLTYFTDDEAGVDDFFTSGVREIISLSNLSGELVYPMTSIAYRANGTKTLLENAAKNSKTIVFRVGSKSAEEKFKEESVTNMFDKVKSYVKLEKITVTNAPQARVRYEEYKQTVEELKQGIITEKEQLEARLEEITESILLTTSGQNQ